MIAANEFALVIVTPERTVLDVAARAVRFPLDDGQIGILPGRAPMVGRVGCGELVADVAGSQVRYYVDGGFCQVKGGVVSILTERAMLPEQLTLDFAKAQLTTAEALPSGNGEEADRRNLAMDRARKLIALKSDRR